MLREQIAAKLERYYPGRFDPEREITVTLGATEGLFSAVQALVGRGEEVIVFDPALRFVRSGGSARRRALHSYSALAAALSLRLGARQGGDHASARAS